MADECTGADSLRVYLTGASAAGQTQADHAQSLGAYRSAVRVQSLTSLRTNPHRGITIDYASGANGVGLGILKASGTDALIWRPPGGSEGSAVTIANGETKQIAGTDANQYVLVSRTSTDNLVGEETIQLLDTINNVISGGNLDITEYRGKYRALMIRNESTASVTGVKVWLDPDYNVISKIAIETPSSGALTDISGDGESTAPAGLTWVAPTTSGTALSIGTLAAGEEVGLWVDRYSKSSEGSVADALVCTVLQLAYTADAVAYQDELRGISRISYDTLDCYELWLSVDSEPDPYAGYTYRVGTLPAELPAVYSSECAVYVHAGKRNKFNLLSMAENPVVAYIAADGTEAVAPPKAPDILNIKPGAGGTIIVTAAYFPARESATLSEVEDLRANKWLVYISGEDTEPDPDTDTPVVVDMSTTTGTRQVILTYTTTATYLENEPVHVLVRTRRDDGDTQIDSTNTTCAETEANWYGPARPSTIITQGRARGLYHSPTSAPSETTYIDEGNNIYWQTISGETRLWADTTLIWNLKGDSEARETSGLYTTFVYIQEEISGVAASDVEVASWTAGDKTIYLAVNGVRRMKIDVTNQTIHCAAMQQGDAPADSSSARVPYWVMYEGSVLQVWAPSKEDYTTITHLDADGVLTHAIPWIQCATEEECL